MREFAIWHAPRRRRPAGSTLSGAAGFQCGCGVVPETGSGAAQVYNEEAFRYFVAHERKRARGTGRPFALVLIDRDPGASGGPNVPEYAVRSVFARLSRCLRETDIVGWYREGAVIGVVLTQLLEPMPPDLQARLTDRVGALLRGDRLVRLAGGLRVRVFQEPVLQVTGGSRELT